MSGHAAEARLSSLHQTPGGVFQQPARAAARAFTLVEVMAVVAIASIFAAVATASLTPLLHRAELAGATDEILGFVQRARVQAMIDRRGAQVFILDKAAAPAKQRVILRSENAYDCEGTEGGFQTQDLDTAPALIVTGAGLWIEVDHLILDTHHVTAQFINHPASLSGNTRDGVDCPSNATGCLELRFRPNGRVWSSDANLTNDTVTVQVTHDITGETKNFTIAGNGVTATLPSGY